MRRREELTVEDLTLEEDLRPHAGILAWEHEGEAEDRAGVRAWRQLLEHRRCQTTGRELAQLSGSRRCCRLRPPSFGGQSVQPAQPADSQGPRLSRP